MSSHQHRAERQDHLPQTAGYTSSDATQYMIGFLHCEGTLLAYVQLAINQYTQLFFLLLKLKLSLSKPLFTARSARWVSGQSQGSSDLKAISMHFTWCVWSSSASLAAQKLLHFIWKKMLSLCPYCTATWSISGWALLPKNHLIMGILCLNQNANNKNVN